MEQDKSACSLVKENVDASTYAAVEKKLSSVKDGNLLTGDCKFQWIDKLVNENVTSKKNKLLLRHVGLAPGVLSCCYLQWSAL